MIQIFVKNCAKLITVQIKYRYSRNSNGTFYIRIKFIQFSDTFPVSELTENSTEFYRLFIDTYRMQSFPNDVKLILGGTFSTLIDSANCTWIQY